MLAHIVDYDARAAAWRALPLDGPSTQLLLEARLFPQLEPGDTVDVVVTETGTRVEKVVELNEDAVRSALLRGLLP
jgi:hypothetical protein